MPPALPGRLALALATLVLGAGGIAVATEGSAEVAEPVVVAPVADRSLACATTGEWTAPDRGAVGLPPGLRLCPHAAADGAGPITIDRPGAVLDGWDLTGGIVVTAPGVVVQRSRITGDGTTSHGVLTAGAGTVRVEDTTLTGRFAEAAIGGDRWTAERVEIVGVAADGVHAGRGVRMRSSVLSRFEPGSGTDGIDVRAGDVRIEDSTVRMGAAHRSAVHLGAVPAGAAAAGEEILLHRNVLGGGGYTVVQTGPGLPGTELVDNRFARDAGVAPLRVPPTVRDRGSTYLDGAPLVRN